MTTQSNFLALARYGWSVIPLHARGKKAHVPWKEYQAHRADEKTIKDWLAVWPEANPGVVTGQVSGIFVLDIDGVTGQRSLLEMGTIPMTPYVITAHGQHYYFAYPPLKPGERIITKAGIAPGMDVRGDGGYVVGPGAIHESGHEYRWELPPDDVPPAPAPDWLLDIVVTSEPDPLESTVPLYVPTEASTNGKARAYALGALKGEAAKVANAADGYKHDRLLRSACAVAGFIPHISESEIEQALYEAIAGRAADKRAARITIRDGIDYGARRPREIPNTNTNGTRPRPSDPLFDDQPDPLLNAALSDTGNAECMIALHGDDFRFDHTRKKWLVWKDARWQVDGDGDAERAAVGTIRQRQEAALEIPDTDRRKKVLNYLISAENQTKQKGLLTQGGILRPFATTIARFDQDIWAAGAPNGLLYLDTGTLYEPSRTHLITMCLGTAVDVEADCPRWLRFLAEVFNDDKELIEFVQRCIGYSLTGDTSEQKMFLCHGSGANGKSVFLETLSLVLGDYAAGTPFATFDADRRTDATNDLAALKGKRFVTVIESDEDRRLAEARVKAVTGQDAITCRFLYGEFFTYKPTFKLWMAMNHKPIIRGTDRGIWRRIVLIPFTQNFEGREDKNLADDLRGELPGILNWAAQGLRRWRSDGLGTARVVVQATEEYRRESDLVGQWFEDCAGSSPTAFTPAAEAYTSFRNWCKTYGFREQTQTSFGRAMEEKGYRKGKEGGTRGYKGFTVLAASFGEDL